MITTTMAHRKRSARTSNIPAASHLALWTCDPWLGAGEVVADDWLVKRVFVFCAELGTLIAELVVAGRAQK
jgi:hypothetical protein